MREPQAVVYLLGLLEDWQQGKRRIDNLCDLAANDATRRRCLESRIAAAIPTIRGIQEAIPHRTTGERRRLQNRCIRLLEEVHLRQRWVQQAPFRNPKAKRFLQLYQDRCRQMAQANLRLVISVARKICGGTPWMLDMIQEGNRGLMHAIAKFDYRRGIRFSTYATPWIRKAILEVLPNTNRNIRLPENVLRVKRQLDRETSRPHPVPSEVPPGLVERFSQQRNIASHQARHLLRSFRDTCSLNLPPAQGSDSGSLANQIVDERQPEPRELAESRERNFLIRELLKSLPGREETVLSLRFGFSDGIHRSLAEVGKTMNLTRERVRQIERTAIEKLAAKTTIRKWEGVRSYESQ